MTRRSALRSTGAPVSPPPKRSWPTLRPPSAVRRVHRIRPGGERYATALARYEAAAAGDFEARLVTTLEHVGLPADLADQAVATLSGGQQARADLAAVLLARFDITLLDEPTNDLDFEGLARLEELVARRSGGLVIVSHDRAFLDRTVTEVLELDEHSRSGRTYGGGWAGYVAEREAERAHAGRGLRRSTSPDGPSCVAGRNASGSGRRPASPARRSARVTTTRRSGTSASTGPRRLASRARQTERALESLEEVEKPWEGWDLHFSISEAARSGDVVVRLEDAVVERGDFTLGPVTLDIGWADRIALVGPNGSGKTTLVQALLGRLPLARGQLAHRPERRGRRAGAGPSRACRTPRAWRTRSWPPPAWRANTPGPNWPSSGWVPTRCSDRSSSLSPGERTRAELAAFAATGVNFLVLDEPTNHLDLPAIEQLESALRGYTGTLLLVSHDRRLLETVPVTRRVELPGGGSRPSRAGSRGPRSAGGGDVGAARGSREAPRSQPGCAAASPPDRHSVRET